MRAGQNFFEKVPVLETVFFQKINFNILPLGFFKNGNL